LTEASVRGDGRTTLQTLAENTQFEPADPVSQAFRSMAEFGAKTKDSPLERYIKALARLSADLHATNGGTVVALTPAAEPLFADAVGRLGQRSGLLIVGHGSAVAPW
jgi:hypothetical protein